MALLLELSKWFRQEEERKKLVEQSPNGERAGYAN